jgi:type IV pilus assembly protein PilM
MSVLGLDIGSDTIKVVDMKGGRGHLTLVNYGIAPTPPGSVVAGDVQDPEAVADAIRQLIKTRRIAGKHVVSCVQGQQSVVVRIIEIPRMGKSELNDTMSFEVERHIPFSASHFIMDFTPVERPNEPQDTPNMEVLFAAAVESMIDDHVAALRAAKLKPTAIDVQPLALSHSLVEGPSGNAGLGQTVAVVNIGANSTDLSIIKDGLLHFPRTIPIGGRSITQRISEGLGISEQQAEKLKRRYGSMAPLPPELAAHLTAAQAPAEAVEAPVTSGLDFAADDLFTLESDDSDMGFGGTGTAGMTFTSPAAAELPEVTFDDGPAPAPRAAAPVGLDLPPGGPSFDFGLPAGPADEPEAPEARFDEGAFDFGAPAAAAPTPAEASFDFAVSDEPTGASASLPDDPEATAFEFELGDLGDFGDSGGASSSSDSGAAASGSTGGAAAAPAAPADSGGSDETTFDFGFDKLDGGAKGSGPQHKLAPDEAHGEPHATPDKGQGDSPDQDHDFAFDLDSDGGGSTLASGSGSGSGSGSAPVSPAESSFDFAFDDAGGGSSLAGGGHTEAPAAGATEVGSSYDLGFLTSDTGSSGGSLDLSLESGPTTSDLGGFDLEESHPPAAAPAAAAAPGALAVLSEDEEELLRVREVMEPVVRELAQEVARSLEYYRSRYEGAVVDRVVLVGGTARIDGLDRFFEDELGLTVENGNPLAEVDIAGGKISPDDLERDAPLLAVAVGLAMRHLIK